MADTDLLTAEQAAAVIGVSPRTFKNWVKDGVVKPTLWRARGHLYSKELVNNLRSWREQKKVLQKMTFGQ